MYFNISGNFSYDFIKSHLFWRPCTGHSGPSRSFPHIPFLPLLWWCNYISNFSLKHPVSHQNNSGKDLIKFFPLPLLLGSREAAFVPSSILSLFFQMLYSFLCSSDLILKRWLGSQVPFLAFACLVFYLAWRRLRVPYLLLF